MVSSDSFVAAGFDALPARVAILEEDGTIVYTNQSWKSFGDEQGLADGAGGVGTNYLAVCDASDDDGDDAARGIRAVADGSRETFSLEYPCHTPTENHWFTMQATAYRHGGERYVLVMHVDVTERKRLEQRTQDQADRMETFATLLSHDLRNPLAVAMAQAESLDLEAGATEIESDSLRSSLERMERIIDDALVLVSVDEVAAPEPVDLADAVAESWSHVRTDDATIEVADATTIRAEPSLLTHLLENLFRNAIDHAGPAPRVDVGLLETADDGGLEDDVVGFYVEDDGPGIAPADREQVFESGYTTATDGSGFGLAIVDHVVDAHGWSIDVRDGEGGGARFEVRDVTTVEW